MSSRIILACCLVCVGAPIGFTRTSRTQLRELTLEETRKILAQPPNTGTIADIPLTGFQSFREILIGAGQRVVAISCTRSGGLIAFGSDGKAIASVQTGEITSLQVVNLVEGESSQITTDEVEGSGTGVLMKVFKLYKVNSSGIREVWKGDSLFRSAPWEPAGKMHVSEKTCFLRFDQSGGGQPATMTHLCVTTGDYHFVERAYEWRGNSLQELKSNP